jgi:hypothetical protein
MAAAGTNLHTLTVIASATLVAGRATTIAGAQAGAGVTSLGPAMNPAVTGDPTPVVVLGTAICQAGAAIAVGAALETNAAGKYITRTSGTIVGRAITAAAADNDMFEALLIPN